MCWTCRFQSLISRNSERLKLTLMAHEQQCSLQILAQIVHLAWETAEESEARKEMGKLLQYLKWEMTLTNHFSHNSHFCGSSGSLSGECGKLTLWVTCSLPCPALCSIIPYLALEWIKELPYPPSQNFGAYVYYFMDYPSSLDFPSLILDLVTSSSRWQCPRVSLNLARFSWVCPGLFKAVQFLCLSVSVCLFKSFSESILP